MDGETAQKSAKPCPRKVGEFVPTLGPVRACRSLAISLRHLNGSTQNFLGRRQTADGMGWYRTLCFKLLKSLGMSGYSWGKNVTL